MPAQRQLTAQGHEVQLATHVLGPHLMTELQLPLLRGASEASVVFVSSGGMYCAALDANDLQSESSAYNQSSSVGGI